MKSRSILNSFCDKVYVIALKENADNKKNISKYLKRYNINFEFIDAVSGSKSKIAQKYFVQYLLWDFDHEKTHELEQKYKKKLVSSPNAFGLSLTYKKIFTQAIKNKYKNICVLEEDFIFSKDIELHLSNFLNHNKDFDLLYLGCSQHFWKDIKIHNIPNTSTRYYEAPNYIDGSFGTIYSLKIYKQILEQVNKFNAPFDSGPLRNIVKNNNSYVLYPNVVVADTTAKSTISNMARNLRNHKYKINWNLKNMDFNRDLWRVSILMANYNNSKTIKQSIQSALNQTYQNFEIIVVDDASTDNSAKVIKEMAKKDNRIKPIYLKNNVGAYKARNIALSKATGFFVTILDPDDFYLSKKIEIDIYNYFNYDKYELFFSNMYRTQNTNYKSIKDNYVLEKIEKEREPNLLNDNNSLFLYGHNAPFDYKLRFGLPTIFTTKSFFETYGCWNENHRYGMDLELIQRYIIQKYKNFIHHTELWKLIYLYKAENLGIYLNPTCNYISFMSDKKNATSICNGDQRETIHNECNKNLLAMLDKITNKPAWKPNDSTKALVRQNIKNLPKNFNWTLYSTMCNEYNLQSRQDCVEHYLSTGNTQFNNIPEYEYVNHDQKDMAVCLCYFSHHANQETANHTKFVIDSMKRANIPIYTIQLLYNEQNKILNTDFTLKTKSQPIFHKENLWNILYNKLKDKYSKFLFVDSDILFSNPKWYELSSALLDKYDLIQPFDTCYWTTSGNKKYSLAYALFNKSSPSLSNHHAGFSIGVNSAWFNNLGYFYDKAIVGGGDLCFWSLVAQSLSSPINNNEIYRYISKYDLSMYAKNIRKFPPRVGYLANNSATHMDHNTIGAKKYSERINFIPKNYESLIKTNSAGIHEINLSDTKLKEYFYKRAL